MSRPCDLSRAASRPGGMVASAAAAASALLAAAVLLSAAPTAGQEATTAPGEPAAIQPLLPPEAFEEAYPGQVGPRPDEFTEEQWIAVLKVRDGSEGSNEEACYLLLEKAPDLDVSAARKVTFEQLKADPKPCRARPVRMALQFLDTVEEPTARPSRIPRVFTTRGFVVLDSGEQEVVVVRSRFRPPDMGPNRHFQVVGYFYKIERFPVKGGGTVEAPVIIAHQISPGTGQEGAAMDTRMVVTIGLVVLLVLLWIFVRFRLGRPGSRAESGYRPRRFEMTESEIERSKLRLDQDESAPGELSEQVSADPSAAPDEPTSPPEQRP